MSISLASGVQTTFTVGGTPTHTANTDAVTGFNIDYIANSVTFTILGGTIAAQTFTPDSVVGDNFSVTFSLTTGNWATSSGLSGNVSLSGLTSIIATLKALRNSSELFAVQITAVNGTQVTWT